MSPGMKGMSIQMKVFGNSKKKVSMGVRIFKTFLTVVIVLGGLGAGMYAAFKIFIEPPEVDTPNGGAAAVTVEPQDEVEVDGAGWREGVYTFLLAGEDDENGGTDVIMVGIYDSDEGTVNIVSIPRDTIVNVPWGVKKINSYKNMYKQLDGDYDQYVDALIDGVENIIGYKVNSYVTIDLDGFVALVDAIGGVEFDVPSDMYYNDPAQNLYIDISKGLQTLSGEDAMGVVRYRHYSDGDIERINVQQALMKAVIVDLLQVSNITKVNTLLDIYADYVDTDLTAQNIGWYADEFLALDSENINFYSLGDAANITDRVNGTSYVSIYVDQWLEMLNTYFNPYNDYEIQEDDLDILTRDENGNFYSTSGTIQGENTWY